MLPRLTCWAYAARCAQVQALANSQAAQQELRVGMAAAAEAHKHSTEVAAAAHDRSMAAAAAAHGVEVSGWLLAPQSLRFHARKLHRQEPAVPCLLHKPRLNL